MLSYLVGVNQGYKEIKLTIAGLSISHITLTMKAEAKTALLAL